MRLRLPLRSAPAFGRRGGDTAEATGTADVTLGSASSRTRLRLSRRIQQVDHGASHLLHLQIILAAQVHPALGRVAGRTLDLAPHDDVLLAERPHPFRFTGAEKYDARR